MSKGLASKVFIMEVATTLQFHVHRSISEVRVLHMPTSRTVSSGVSEWYFGYDLAPVPLWWWIVSEYVDFGEHWCC